METILEKTVENIPLTTPFGKIAVSLSGGGFRAASFGLGTLSYLQHLKLEYDELGNPTNRSLLDNVCFISSASGGTITAGVYSMMRNKRQSFGTIYNKLLTVLHGEGLLNSALTKLNDDGEWGQPGNYKRRNLINSFAKAYDELVFQDEKFGVYWSEEGLKNFEVCFNATEFNRGLFFRFQTDGEKDTMEFIGNNYIHFNNNSPEYKKIRLSDILAASSCFPSGFEPIVFPEDFSYNDKNQSLDPEDLRKSLLVRNYEEEMKPLKTGKSIGLMDGGITDNQGIYSAMLADNRRRNKGNGVFDLFIVADVASYFMDSYKVPEEKYEKGWQKKSLKDYLQKIHKIGKGLKVIFIATVLVFILSVACIFVFKSSAIRITSAFFTGISVCLGIILFYLNRLQKKFQLSKILEGKFDFKNFLLKTVPSIKNFSAAIIDRLIEYFKGTKLGVLQQMVSARVSSVLIMVSDINLKHVRRLIFDEFYNSPRWKNRRCSNFIYELTRQNEKARRRHLKENDLTDEDLELLKASPAIMDMAESAWLMGTTLWFDKGSEGKLKEVVSCGQFSTCVNLLRYILQIEKDSTLEFTEPVKKMISGLKQKLVSDWKKFNEDPCFLFEYYGEQKERQKMETTLVG